MSIKALCSRSACALALFSSVSFAQAASFVLEAGLHDGGDDLLTATFTNGDSETLEAGGLYSFSLGGAFDISTNVESRITIGIKEDSITASNGDVKFTRYPIDALFLYKLDNWRLGGGITYHLSPEVSGSGVVTVLDGDFDDALGFLLEADYMFDSFYTGMRFTFIDYELSSTGAEADGNSVGIVIGAQF